MPRRQNSSGKALIPGLFFIFKKGIPIKPGETAGPGLHVPACADIQVPPSTVT